MIRGLITLLFGMLAFAAVTLVIVWSLVSEPSEEDRTRERLHPL